MEDSDILDNLRMDRIPPPKQVVSKRRQVFDWMSRRAGFKVVSWATRPAHPFVKNQFRLHPRLFVTMVMLLLAVGTGTAYAALSIHTTSQATVGTTTGTITAAIVTIPSGSSGTPGTCTIAADGQSATCSGTTLTGTGDTYDIILTIATSSSPGCTSSVTSGASFSVGTPVTTGSGSPFTVTTTVTGTAPGSGSVAVSC